MKDLLQKISIPLENDMQKFHKEFKNSLYSEVKLINTVIGYISRKKGKQLRPRLSLLSAKMCGNPTKLTF